MGLGCAESRVVAVHRVSGSEGLEKRQCMRDRYQKRARDLQLEHG